MTVSFEEIKNNNFTDLIVDEIYVGGTKGNRSDDVISKLFKVGNAGGIRYQKGSLDIPKIVVLYTTGEEVDWPDSIDIETGTVTYFGDNRTPGNEIDSKRGNKKIKAIFEALNHRAKIPPIFLVKKEIFPNKNSVKFIGLLVPGSKKQTNEDFIAMWNSKNNSRFQNYKITFTILDESIVKKEWIEDIISGNAVTSTHAPKSWLDWVNTGKIKPLTSRKNNELLTKADQLPKSRSTESKLLHTLNKHFGSIKNGDYYFEKFVNYILSKYWDKNVVSIENTRFSQDGGIDGIGQYRIGIQPKTKNVQFYVQSKRYTNSSVGVRDVARLISRIRYRQFGVMVTTSYVNKQALKEVQDDEHPIIFISAIDLIRILQMANIGSVKALKEAFKTDVDDNYDF
tara:strand:- start:287 stop:1477 length:1191 start_codon:yes stop_codon:yes gene_type:complete